MNETIAKTMLDLIPDGVVLVNENGEVQYANWLGENLFGIEENDDGYYEFENKYFRHMQKSFASSKLLIWHDITDMVKLLEISVIDLETGVYSSRFLQEDLDREFDRVRRANAQMALALIDVDAGTNGPSMREIAQTLKASVRNFDRVFRGTRSNFAVMFFAITNDKIESFAQRIMTVLKDKGVLAVSVGLTLSEKSPSADAMLRQAQRALYVVNARGGNSFSVY